MFDTLPSHEIVISHAGLSEPLRDRYECPTDPIGPTVQFNFVRLTNVTTQISFRFSYISGTLGRNSKLLFHSKLQYIAMDLGWDGMKVFDNVDI